MQATIEIGSLVTVSNAKTNNEPVQGEVVAIAKGWYNVETDLGTISARLSSLTLAAEQPASDEESEEPDEQTQPTAEGEETPEGEEEAEQTAAAKMAEALRHARPRYQKTKRPSGASSADCADAIAKELRDLEPMDVADLADKVLNVEPGTHRAKYASLNNGQIRMNSGNRIRAYWKNINEEGNEAEIERVAILLNLNDIEEDEEQAA